MHHTIEVKNISKILGDQEILRGVSGRYQSGRIYGSVGRNGSGKTVFFKCICGFMKVSKGEILQNGKSIGGKHGYLKDCGFLIERPGFLENESGYKNLKYLASINNKIAYQDIEKSIEQVGLNPKDKRHVGKYSMGMKQRLGIAQAIMEDPGILILDEPMNGLDDIGVELIRKLLLNLKEEGKLILLASHYKEDIEYLCDEVFRFDAGVLEKVEG